MARSVHLDGVQTRLYIFGFLGPLGLDSGRFTTPFLKCVSSNFSKKTNNPNPSPIKKIWLGLYWFGAGGDTELFEKASNINGFQGGRVANNLYISPFRATVFQTAALFLYPNSSVVIRVENLCFLSPWLAL